MELKNSHGGYHGKTIVQRISDKLDEAYSAYILDVSTGKIEAQANSNGICIGLAMALGILRSSSDSEEINLAAERFFAYKNSQDGVVT
jgi:hypothetical protein